MDCRNCSTTAATPAPRGRKAHVGWTKDCCSRSVRDVDDVAAGSHPVLEASGPPVNRKVAAPRRPSTGRLRAGSGSVDSSEQVNSETRRDESSLGGGGFWIEGDSGVGSRTSAGTPAWNSLIKGCVWPTRQSLGLRPWIASPIQHGVAALGGIPWYQGLITPVVRGLLVDDCGTCTKSRLGPWGRSGIGRA